MNDKSHRTQHDPKIPHRENTQNYTEHTVHNSEIYDDHNINAGSK